MNSHRLNTNYFELPIVHGQTSVEACFTRSSRRRTTSTHEGVLVYWCNILTGFMASLQIMWKVYVLTHLFSDLIHHEQSGKAFASFVSNPLLWTSLLSILINVCILICNRQAAICSKFIYLVVASALAAVTFWFDILLHYNKSLSLEESLYLLSISIRHRFKQ